MLTNDSVTVSVDAVVYYRVSNATISVANVENAHHSTRYKDALIKSSHTVWRLLAQTTLRNILGTKNLHEILSDRESISCSMQVGMLTFYVVIISWLFKGFSWWGYRALGYQGWASWNVSLIKVKVEKSPDLNRKDVRLPVQLQRAMAAEAEAAREARAKVILLLLGLVA